MFIFHHETCCLASFTLCDSPRPRVDSLCGAWEEMSGRDKRLAPTALQGGAKSQLPRRSVTFYISFPLLSGCTSRPGKQVAPLRAKCGPDACMAGPCQHITDCGPRHAQFTLHPPSAPFQVSHVSMSSDKAWLIPLPVTSPHTTITACHSRRDLLSKLLPPRLYVSYTSKCVLTNTAE